MAARAAGRAGTRESAGRAAPRAQRRATWGQRFFGLLTLLVLLGLVAGAGAVVGYPPAKTWAVAQWKTAMPFVLPPLESRDVDALAAAHKQRMTTAKKEHEREMAERQRKVAALRDEIADRKQRLAPRPPTPTPTGAEGSAP